MSTDRVDVLEFSNIAWPNTAMWSNAPRLFKYNSRSTYSGDLKEEDTHAHSPVRHEARAAESGSSQASNPALYNVWGYRGTLRESRWAAQEPYMADPFIDPYVLDASMRPRGARSSIEDVPMPDYGSSSTSSRAFSSMTGISYEHSKQPSLGGPIDEAQYNQLTEALAARAQVPGTHAPVNTPSAAALPSARRLSAAAEARSVSYSRGGSRNSVLKEISQQGSRNVSESSARSNLATDTTIEAASRKLQVSPGNTGSVRSRKEGSTGQENKENEGSADTPLREIRTPSKVRASGSVDNESKRTQSGSHMSKEEHVGITPTKNLQPAAADDPVLQGSLEDFFDARIQLGGAVEVSEID